MRKNVAGQYVGFQMVSATDGSAVTAGTPTVYVTLDGGTQTTGAGTSTHEGNGQWSYAPTQAETNGDHVIFTMAISGAISQGAQAWPVSFDPTDSVRAGLTALPNANAEAAGGLYTRGTGAGQINQSANGQIDVNAERLNNVAQSLIDLKDFADTGYDPATNKIEGVKLVDTTTTNTDMRGTDSAILAASAPANWSAMLITVGGQLTVGTNNDKTGYTVSTVTDKTGYSISGTKTTLDALNDVSAAQVNAEVLDVLTVDTFVEPGQGSPPATTSILGRLQYLYKAWRNKSEQTATESRLFNDAGSTVDQKATVSDDGTTFTKGEQGTGP